MEIVHNTSDNDVQIIQVIGGEARVDSRVFCQRLEIEHNRFLNNIIYKYQSDFEEFGHLPFEKGTVTNSVGAVNQQVYASLNEEQCTLALTYVKNTLLARQLKKDLVKEFSYLKHQQPTDELDVLEGAIKSIRNLRNRVDVVEDRQDKLEQTTKALMPNTQHYTITGYTNMKGMHINSQQAKQAGKEAKRLSNLRGYEVGKSHHERWGQVGTYHVDILDEVFGLVNA